QPLDQRRVIPRDLRLVLALCVIVGGFLAIGVLVLLAWTHIGDRYQVDARDGTFLAMARAVDQGMMYPRLYDPETQSFGGARIMPVRLMLNAFASRVTGEYLSAAKYVSAASMFLLVFLMGLVMGRLKCSTVAAIGAIGAALMTQPMLIGATSVQMAALPTALQLMAIMLFVNRKGDSVKVVRRNLFFASLACTAAIFCRMDALWGSITIMLWLTVRQPRELWIFLGYQIGMVLVAGAFFHLITDGRFVDVMFRQSLTETGDVGAVWRVPLLLFMLLSDHAPATWVLLPLASFGLILRTMNNRFHIVHVALVCSVVILLVTLAKSGTSPHSMIDVIVLGAICAADLWRTVQNGDKRMDAAQAAMSVMFLWSILGGLFMHVRGDALASLNTVLFDERNPDLDRRPLVGWLTSEQIFLSEDPYLDVELDLNPVVYDAKALKRLGDQQPGLVETLVRRLENREFEIVVLLRELAEEKSWYAKVHFGPKVSEAIRRNYVYRGKYDSYHLYVPSDELE
ncbi:MAG: hypothetical protein O7G85_13430, partial [Planctomycetota bacterium]|nr:hypothetical protein [Planctomycetota bacterium]